MAKQRDTENYRRADRATAAIVEMIDAGVARGVLRDRVRRIIMNSYSSATSQERRYRCKSPPK